MPLKKPLSPSNPRYTPRQYVPGDFDTEYSSFSDDSIVFKFLTNPLIAGEASTGANSFSAATSSIATSSAATDSSRPQAQRLDLDLDYTLARITNKRLKTKSKSKPIWYRVCNRPFPSRKQVEQHQRLGKCSATVDDDVKRGATPS